MTSLEPAPTAAALIIGNELLSGKVEESNLPLLARTFRGLGIELRRVVMTLDDIDVIAEEVRELSATHDWLITSGGVGPTHDDVTIEAVAKAFDMKVVSSPAVEDMIRTYYGDRCTPGHLRMALMPEGAVLEVSPEIRWPTLRVKNTWLMPGIPEVFRMKLPVIISRISAGKPYISRAVYTQMEEGNLKPLLDAVVAQFKDVDVGSYPKWRDPTYKTKLTFDGRDEARVLAASDFFVTLLPAGEPQRID
ncbi:MAG: competence/damage-inducible protein A [Polyangiaceae bacterium]